MNWGRIKGVMLQEYYITRKSLESIFDIFFFSIVNIVIFGFVSIYLAGSNNPQAANYIIVGMILWEIIRISQYTLSVGSLWNVWSRNLSNMFISPLTMKEYIVGHMLAGCITSFIVFMLVSLIGLFAFNFNFFQVGLLNILIYFVNLILFAYTTGIAILGLIFRYGTRIQALSWGLVFLFQPLCATLFPVNVLPTSLQQLAYVLPPTYVFEAARANVVDPTVNWPYALIALVLNLIYFSLSLVLFKKLYTKSLETGQFARNEG